MNQREKILVGAAVVVAGFFGAPVAMDALGTTQNVDQTIARLKESKRSKEADARSLSKQIEQLQPRVRAIASSQTPDQLRQEMVRRLNQLSQSSGVTLVTTRPLKPRNLEYMTEVSVEMHLTGNLASLVKFVHPIQQPSSRLSIDRLRLSAANTESDVLDIDMTVSGYTLQAPTESTKTETSSPT